MFEELYSQYPEFEVNKMIEDKIKNRWEEIAEEALEKGREEKAIRVAERALQLGTDPEDVAYVQELPLSKVLEIKEKISC
jgi:predicted transposase YdaD